MLGKFKNNLFLFRKLSGLFNRKEKIRFFMVAFAALSMAIFQALGVASILPFVNLVMDPNAISENSLLNYVFILFNFESVNSFMVLAGFLILALLVIGNLISALATWLKVNFVWEKNNSLSTILLKKYLSMPYAYFLNKNTAELGKNILAEVQQLTSSFLMPLINMITNGILVIIIFILLLYVNASVTFFAVLVLFSLYSLIYLYLAKKLKKGGVERLEENRERYKTASEALEGIKDIKILGTEKFFFQKFLKHSAKFSKLQAWNNIVGQIPRYIMEIIAFGGVISFLIFSIALKMPVEEVIPMVSFFAFAGYKLMPALQEIFSATTSIKFNAAILDKIYYDLTEKGSAYGNFIKIKAKPISFKREIELEKIFFAYPENSRKALKDINLRIKKKSFVAFIGATGSGKTTLADIILGLLSSDKGSIKIDGIKIDKNNIRNWQACLGYVPQFIYLSDDTVSRNIAFGIPDEKINKNRIKEVAKMANIHDFIEKELPDSYNTVVGERGIRLSGGQRQRIGIARALYRDPQVLIFDEATSSLDDKTEEEVLAAIEKVAKLKTMIVIAHRLTTIRHCDKVFVVERGKIIREGGYKDIINYHDNIIDES